MKEKYVKTTIADFMQYIVLFVVYIVIESISVYAISLIFSNQDSNLYFLVSSMVYTLLAFLVIVTKTTPISVFLFGGLTYICFGNGSVGNVFFMALFPIIYFVEKKGLLRSKKYLLYTLFACMALLGLDTLYLWVQYHELGFDMFGVGISFVLTLIYSIHKPKCIKKWFPVTEEFQESKKHALSTRIIFVFGIIAFLVFLADLYSFEQSESRKNSSKIMHVVQRVESEASSVLKRDAFSSETAKKVLDLVGKNYEGVICFDVQNGEYIEAYQEDVSKTLNRSVFQSDMDSMLSGNREVEKSNQIAFDNKYYSISYFEVNDDSSQEVGTPRYVVFLIEYEGGIIMGDVMGIRSSFSRFFVLLCMLLPIFFWLIDFMITKPINQMTALVSRYVYSNDEQRNELEKQFNELHIHSGDEIENLYHSFGKTILDMNTYIDDLHLKNEQITKMQFSMISTLANVVENRDKNTGSHIKRTAEYVEIIGNQMRKMEKYKEVLTKKYIEDMKIAAPLHDLGKIHVSDTILNKPGKLDEEEYAIMKTHSEEGKRILQQTIKEFGEYDYLLMAVEMAGAHHERYDGHGYPEGLAGDEIPLCARIMAVADVFDALVSKRSYKSAMPLSKAYSIIEEGRGTQFDPDAVDAFFAAKGQIEQSYYAFD